jgi:hypothetical protein
MSLYTLVIASVLLSCLHVSPAHRMGFSRSVLADVITPQLVGVAAVSDLPATAEADPGTGGDPLNATTTRTLLRNCYAPHRALDILINHYEEDLLGMRDKLASILQHPSVAKHNPCVVVYTKAAADPSQVAAVLPFASIRWLPNVGQEGHSWTHHFASMYDNLADHTLTLQGSVECEDVLMPKLDALTAATGFLCICGFSTANCTGTTAEGYLQQDYRLAQLWAMTQQDFCFGTFNICYRGQFIVSSKRVRHHPAAMYHRLHTLLGVPGDHEVHQDAAFLKEPTDMEMVAGGGPNAPLLGHTLERAWSFMFNCHHPLGPAQQQQQQEQEPGSTDSDTDGTASHNSDTISSWGHSPRLPPQHVLTLDGSQHCDCFEPDPQYRGVECRDNSLRQRACQCLDRALLPHHHRR